jgi:hypothetical protein
VNRKDAKQRAIKLSPSQYSPDLGMIHKPTVYGVTGHMAQTPPNGIPHTPLRKGLAERLSERPGLSAGARRGDRWPHGVEEYNPTAAEQGAGAVRRNPLGVGDTAKTLFNRLVQRIMPISKCGLAERAPKN